MARVSTSLSPGNVRLRRSARSATNELATDSDDATRHAMISEAAYFRAERRGFAPGYELEDWLASENEVGAKFGSHALGRRRAVSGDMH